MWMLPVGRSFIKRSGWQDEKNRNSTDTDSTDGSGFCISRTGADGWVRSGESWNYYKSDGTMASNQWIKSGDVLFWIQEDGTMAVNTWLESGDEKYWLDGSGAAVTGWQEIDGKWYYFQEDNTMATDMTIDSYYVGKDGAWVVGK